MEVKFQVRFSLVVEMALAAGLWSMVAFAACYSRDRPCELVIKRVACYDEEVFVRFLFVVDERALGC